MTLNASSIVFALCIVCSIARGSAPPDDDIDEETSALIQHHGITHLHIPPNYITDDPHTNEDNIDLLIDLVTECITPDAWQRMGGDEAAFLDSHPGTLRLTAPLPIAAECQSLIKRLTLALDNDTSIERAWLNNWRRNPPPYHYVMVDGFPMLRADVERPLVIHNLRGLSETLNLSWLDPESYVEHIIDLVTELIEPDDWRDYGGDLAECASFDTAFIIIAPIHTQLAVDDLLTRLTRAHEGDWSVEENVRAHWARAHELPDHTVLSIHDISAITETVADQDDAAEWLIEEIQDAITPEDWVDMGGDIATFRLLTPRLLIIDHTPRAQLAIDRLIRWYSQP